MIGYVTLDLKRDSFPFSFIRSIVPLDFFLPRRRGDDRRGQTDEKPGGLRVAVIVTVKAALGSSGLWRLLVEQNSFWPDGRQVSQRNKEISVGDDDADTTGCVEVSAIRRIPSILATRPEA